MIQLFGEKILFFDKLNIYCRSYILRLTGEKSAHHRNRLRIVPTSTPAIKIKCFVITKVTFIPTVDILQ